MSLGSFKIPFVSGKWRFSKLSGVKAETKKDPYWRRSCSSIFDNFIFKGNRNIPCLNLTCWVYERPWFNGDAYKNKSLWSGQNAPEVTELWRQHYYVFNLFLISIKCLCLFVKILLFSCYIECEDIGMWEYKWVYMYIY